MPASPELFEWIGYAAAVLTTCSFVPQAVLTLRTRDVSGISSGMYASFTLGVALWSGQLNRSITLDATTPALVLGIGTALARIA